MSVFVVGCGDLPVHGGKTPLRAAGGTPAPSTASSCAANALPSASVRLPPSVTISVVVPHQRGRVPAVAEDGGARDDAFLRQDFRNRAPRNQRQRLRAQIDHPSMSCTLLPCAPTRRSKASPARAVPCRTARSVMLTPTAEAEGQREDQCQRQNAPRRSGAVRL